MATDTVLIGTVAVTVLVLFVVVLVSPAAEFAQGTEEIDLRQAEDETVTVKGPLESVATTITQNPDEATIELTNNATGAFNSTTLSESESATLTVGSVDVDVTLAEVHGANETSFQYALDRDAFVDPTASPVVSTVYVLLFFAALIGVAKLVIELV